MKIVLPFVLAGVSVAGISPAASDAARATLQSEHLVLRSLDHAQDMTGDRRVFLSASTARDTYFVGEPIHVRLRIGIEPEFLRTSMVQLFAHPLDVPVQLQAPWLDDLAGTTSVTGSDEVALNAARSTFALGESIASAVRAPDDLTGAGRHTVLEVDRLYIPKSAGELAIPEALLYFAHATRFDDDFLNGRIAKDRVDAFVKSKPVVLRVLPLPEKDRPAGFTGAVGRFSIEVDATPRTVGVGQSLKLALTIEGDGNLAAFDAPQLRELDGFKVYGSTEVKERTRRVITYDVAPESPQLTEVPPIAFAYFDPTAPGAYRTLKSRPIRLEVRRAAESMESASSKPAVGQRAPADPNDADAPSSPSKEVNEKETHGLPWGVWIPLSLPFAFALMVAVRRRRRAGNRREEPPEQPIGHDERDPTH